MQITYWGRRLTSFSAGDVSNMTFSTISIDHDLIFLPGYWWSNLAHHIIESLTDYSPILAAIGNSHPGERHSNVNGKQLKKPQLPFRSIQNTGPIPKLGFAHVLPSRPVGFYSANTSCRPSTLSTPSSSFRSSEVGRHHSGPTRP